MTSILNPSARECTLPISPTRHTADIYRTEGDEAACERESLACAHRWHARVGRACITGGLPGTLQDPRVPDADSGP
jgi:hypothetical protein